MSCVPSVRSFHGQSPMTQTTAISGCSIGTSKVVRRLEHIKSLMVQKVSRLYKDQTGKKITTSKLAFINEEIDIILTSRNPSDNDLHRLVQKLRSRGSSGRQSNASYNSLEITGSREGTTCCKAPPISSSVGIVSEIASEPRRSEGTPSRPIPPGSIPPGHQTRIRQFKNDMWAKLSRKDLQDFEVEEDRRRKLARDRMLKQKISLDQQIQQQEEKKKIEKREAEAALESEAKKLERWRSEQDEDDRKRRENYENEKRQRDAQLRDIDRRRRDDDDLKKREEEMISAKIKSELEADQRAAMKKKQTAKENVAKYMEYNAEQRALKDSQKAREFESDKQLHKMYVEKLERQEREREEGLKKLYDRQSRQATMGSKIAAGLAERAMQDEQRAAREQERMLEKVQREERMRLDAITTEKEKIKRYLAQQIEEKERRKQEEKLELLSLRESLMADVKAAESQEKERARAKRQRDVANRAAIEQQIQTKAVTTSSGEAMTDQERLINRKLLRRLSDTVAP